MYKGPKEVIIRRIPRAGFFGITAFPKSTVGLGAELGKHGFKTGLTKDEEAYYEDKLGLKPGDLNPHSKWWGDVFNVEHIIRLFSTKSTTLVLDSPLSQVKYKVLLASSKIAPSEIEKNKPGAEFYIVDEEAKAKMENEIFDYEWEGMELVLKLTPEEKRGALRLFGKKGVDTMSETVLKAELRKQIEKDPKLFVDTLKDKRLKTRMFIEDLIEHNVLKRSGNYYMNGEDTIATSTDECIEFFEDIKNQSVKLALETRLKKAKKG